MMPSSSSTCGLKLGVRPPGSGAAVLPARAGAGNRRASSRPAAEGGELRLAERELEVAAVGDLMRVREQFGMLAANSCRISAGGRKWYSPVQALLRMLPAAAGSACGCFARCRISTGRRAGRSESGNRHAGQSERALVEGVEAVDCQVEAAGEEAGPVGVGADGKQAVGRKAEIRRLKSKT